MRGRITGRSGVKSIFLASLVLGVVHGVWADVNQEKGVAVASEADRRNEGFGDTVAELTMILGNAKGDETVRKLKVKTLEGRSDGDKSMLIFNAPPDVRGTALLTFAHKIGNDDQWLFLPALKRVKRIASNNRAGSFMGSEFAYEDLSAQEVEKFTYRYIGEETLDGADCFIVERRPVDKKSGYTRQVVWYDQEQYRILKVDFYDRKDALLKTMSARNYHLYLEKYWRAHEQFMVNHQTGKNTALIWKDYAFDTGLSDRDFDRNSLARVR